MVDKVARRELVAMLRGAAALIMENHELLSRLDGATGDGDHGTTMVRSMKALERAVADNAGAGAGELLQAIGWGIMSADGGSTGPLLGSLFMGMGEAVQEEMDCAALVAALAAGIGKMHRQSRAQIGDRTMMDALLPALAALQERAGGGSVVAALDGAVAAAVAGAEATSDMKARFGRARNLGDRVIGHRDPGAVTISLLLKGMRQGLDSCSEEEN